MRLSRPAAVAALAASLLAGACAEVPYEHPRSDGGGEGAVTISPERVDAAEEARFRVTWTAGPSGLHHGGGFRVQLPLDPRGAPGGFTPPQASRWYLIGYVSCRVLAGGGSTAQAEAQVRMGGELRCRLSRGRLAEGDSLVLEYRGLAPRVAGDYALAVQSRLTGGRGGRPLARRAVLRVGPRPARQLAAIAPSLVEAGEPFSLTLVALDEFGNRDVGYLGAVGVTFDGERSVRVLGPRDGGVGVVEGLAARDPGFAVATVEELDVPQRALAARSNPIRVVERAAGERVLWGDLHFRTGSGAGGRSFAPLGRPSGDGRGNLTTLEGAFAYARDVARLDFAGATEVVGPLMTESVWSACAGIVAAMDDPPRFTALAGLQWADRLLLVPAGAALPGGGRDRPGPPPAGVEAAVGGLLRAGGLHVSLRAAVPAEVEATGTPAVLEIDSGLTPRDPLDRRPEALEPGARWLRAGGPPVALVAGSAGSWGRAGVDARTGLEPDAGGLTAVRARGNGGEAILDALRRGRAWATSGARMWLRFERQGARLLVEAAGTAPLLRVDLVVVSRAGVEETPLLRDRVETFVTEVPVPAAGAPSFCYLRAVQRGGETAWSSPVALGVR